MWKSSAREALRLERYRLTVEKNLQEAVRVATVRFCNWSCESVCNGTNDPLLTYFTNETRLYLKPAA
jgi:hypothetical protein